MNQQHQQYVIRFASMLFVVTTLLSMTGCNVIGLFASATENRKVPARYELEDRKTLIIVDDPRTVVGDPMFGNRVMQMIDNELRMNQVVTETVPLETWLEFQRQQGETEDPAKQLPLTTIGQRLGADQIIYVFLTEASMAPNPGVWQPWARAKVKVWDVENSRRTFPSGDSSGYSFETKMKASQRSVEGPGSQYVLVREFADHVGDNMAKLFYEHKLPPVGSTLEPME